MPPVPTPPDRLLVVVQCTGQRCRALTDLRDPHRPACDPALAAAVRSRPRSVLVTTGCLGPCHRGAVAAVGWGDRAGSRVSWTEPAVLVERVEEPARMRATADWIRSGAAPDRGCLETALGSPTGR